MRRDNADAADGHTRRGVLRTMAAVGAAGVASLAGCSGMTSRRYEAAPIALNEGGAELGYRLHDSGTWESTRNGGASEVGIEATLVNHYAAYRSHETDLGFVAMPAVEEVGQSLNPLADRPLDEVINSDAAQSLLRKIGIGGEGNVEWNRGPERIDEKEVEFLRKTSPAAAFAGVTTENDAMLLHIVRVKHEGDIVFGVQAVARSMENKAARPTKPLSSGGGGWSPGKPWDRFGSGLGFGGRFDPCLPPNIRGVRITKPDHKGYVNIAGQTTGGYQFPIKEVGGTPSAKITAEAKGWYWPCGKLPRNFDHFEWSYRKLTSKGSCGPKKNKWVSAGTGRKAKFWLPDCMCGATPYEIRVQAYDSNGNVVDSDTIKYYVNAVAC